MTEVELHEALDLRSKGDYEQALEALQTLARAAQSEDIAQCALYELAMTLHAIGQHEQGDVFCAVLGFKYRLNDDIFEAGSNIKGRAVSNVSNGVGDFCAFDGAVPKPLFDALRKVFSPESDFWPSHEYPTDSFFSYNVPLTTGAAGKGKGNGKGSKDTQHGSAGAELIRELARVLLPLADTITDGEASRTVTSAEWWAHCRVGACAGHQMHWDLDESRLCGPQTPHPLVSTVLYLEGSGGPTLVTDSRLSVDQTKADQTRGWLCPAQEGRVLLFKGDLLHGVTPSIKFDSKKPRTTLMIGLWPAGVTTMVPQSVEDLGPNMESAPKDTIGSWWKQCLKGPHASGGGGGGGADKSKPLRPSKVLMPASKIWHAIDQKGATGRDEDHVDLVDDVGRFLLRMEPSELRDTMVPMSRPEESSQGDSDEYSESESEDATAVAPPVAVQTMSLSELKRRREEQEKAAAAGGAGAGGRKGKNKQPASSVGEVQTVSLSELKRRRGDQ